MSRRNVPVAPDRQVPMPRGASSPEDVATATMGRVDGHGGRQMFDTGVLVIALILLPAVGLLTLVTLVLIEVD